MSYLLNIFYKSLKFKIKKNIINIQFYKTRIRVYIFKEIKEFKKKKV